MATPYRQVRYLGKRKLLLREPDDVAAVLARPGEDAFRKHPRQQRVSAFLGGEVAGGGGGGAVLGQWRADREGGRPRG